MFRKPCVGYGSDVSLIAFIFVMGRIIPKICHYINRCYGMRGKYPYGRL